MAVNYNLFSRLNHGSRAPSTASIRYLCKFRNARYDEFVRLFIVLSTGTPYNPRIGTTVVTAYPWGLPRLATVSAVELLPEIVKPRSSAHWVRVVIIKEKSYAERYRQMV